MLCQRDVSKVERSRRERKGRKYGHRRDASDERMYLIPTGGSARISFASLASLEDA